MCLLSPSPLEGEGVRGEGFLTPLCQRHKHQIFWPHIIRTRANNLAVFTLLDHVRTPASHAGNDENRCEHIGRHTHLPVGNGREPVEVREHFLQFPHGAFQTVGDVVHLHVAVFFGKLLGNALDDHVTRVGKGVNRVAETNDNFLAGNPCADVGFGFIGTVVTGLDTVSGFVGSTVFRATQMRRLRR